MLKTVSVVLILVVAAPALAGSICGQVTDSVTSLPVSGAGVFLGDAAGDYLGQYAATDALGGYCFDNLSPGTYSFEVKVDDYRAAFVTGIEVTDDISTVAVSANLPLILFEAPWPNPAVSLINFRLQIRSPLSLELEIFDARGRRVRAWSAGRVEAGPLRYRWDGRDKDGRPAPSGVYFVRVSTQDHLYSRRFLLTR
jgi:hypothetical protein